MRKVLLLTIGMFALGFDAYVVAGLLPDIGATFRINALQCQDQNNIPQKNRLYTKHRSTDITSLGTGSVTSKGFWSNVTAGDLVRRVKH